MGSWPINYRMLFILRIGFILLYCPVYIFAQTDVPPWKEAFVIGTIILFIVNHVLYDRTQKLSLLFLIAGIDFLAASSYGFVFLGGNLPDQAVMGLVGLILFMRVSSPYLVIVWLTLLVAYWVTFLTVEYHYLGRIDVVAIIVNTAFIVFLTFIGSLIRFYKQSREEAAELYEQLRKYAKQVENLGAAKERSRIAREIHDSIGHMLTSLLVQLQVTRKLHPVDQDKSFDSLIKSEELARVALQEVRLSVRAMRDEDWKAAFLESLRTLIHDFSIITGMNITFHSDDDITGVQQQIQLSIYRIVQEFLTNAHKHGKATLTIIHLQRNSNEIELVLQDNGEGTAEVKEGCGIRSMSDRVEEHGGTIRITSDVGSGFQVAISIPLLIDPFKERNYDTRLSG
ncbi:signal transduction histidine kinase [Paenibacillus sp. DS2015]|uniref:sensor histidine kinase n=1 Tax=Paenibacillus sp. DS2015 TaxID=3373917 RepID=UPI003D257323